MPSAEWRRWELSFSTQAATLWRAWVRLVKRRRRRSSNSSVECQPSMAALSNADPGRPMDWRTRGDRRRCGRRGRCTALGALIGVEDDPGDRVRAAADGDRHRQRRIGQVGVVVLAQGEPEDASGGAVQHAVQPDDRNSLPWSVGISVPSPYHLRFGWSAANAPADQVWGPPAAPSGPGGGQAAPGGAGLQPQFAQDRRDGVLADPPAGLAQVRGDPGAP
jgi:hypothetical protein